MLTCGQINDLIWFNTVLLYSRYTVLFFFFTPGILYSSFSLLQVYCTPILLYLRYTVLFYFCTPGILYSNTPVLQVYCTPVLQVYCSPVLQVYCTPILLYFRNTVLLYSCTPGTLYSYSPLLQVYCTPGIWLFVLICFTKFDNFYQYIRGFILHKKKFHFTQNINFNKSGKKLSLCHKLEISNSKFRLFGLTELIVWNI